MATRFPEMTGHEDRTAVASVRRRAPLPTKIVRAPDGDAVRMKVVQSESPTLAEDLLAAFRSNVRRLRSERSQSARAAKTLSPQKPA